MLLGEQSCTDLHQDRGGHDKDAVQTVTILPGLCMLFPDQAVPCGLHGISDVLWKNKTGSRSR